MLNRISRFPLFLALLSSALVLRAQAPAAIHYQAIVRDGSGAILGNQTAEYEFSFLRNSIILYSERQTILTNGFGLVNAEIGKGSPVSGDLDSIDWSLGNIHLQVRVDMTGQGMVGLGTKQLVSVPYSFYADGAMFAARAIRADSIDMNLGDLQDVSGTPLTDQVLKWDGANWMPADDEVGVGGGIGQINAGAGLTGGGSTATVTIDARTTDPIWNADQLMGRDISSAAPTVGHVLKWDGTKWFPATDQTSGGTVTGLTAGAGLSGGGTSGIVTISAQTGNALWNANKLLGRPLATTIPATGQIIKWNGVDWAPANEGAGGFWAQTGNDISYVAGNAYVGRTTALAPDERFGFRVTTGAGAYGGMYAETSDSLGLPFYGYATGGAVRARSYYDHSNQSWRINIGGQDHLTVKSDGKVGIGTSSPGADLTVEGQFRLLANGFTRAEIITQNSVGIIELKGANGSTNVSLASLSTNNNYGYIHVANANSTDKAGIRVNSSGLGEVYGDTKNFRMDHPEQEDKEIWYASVEGPEAAAYLRGTAQLVDGVAKIKFPHHWSLVANGETMTFILTPKSADSEGLAVVDWSLGGFTVRELHKGTGSYPIDWEVKAVRKGYEDYQVIRAKTR